VFVTARGGDTRHTRILPEENLVFEYMSAATGAGSAAPTSGGYTFYGFKGKTAAQ